ncbi:MAG: hypothetical protein WCG25_05845 [bacterium]
MLIFKIVCRGLNQIFLSYLFFLLNFTTLIFFHFFVSIISATTFAFLIVGLPTFTSFHS